MITVRESALWLDCEGSALMAVLAQPKDSAVRRGIGVVIVVGGPQYRVGSHRQFTLLARRLAAAGYPTLRFDYRGMGDSEGEPRSFTAVKADITIATTALLKQTGVGEVVLWGLCDAASAVLLSIGEKQRIGGVVLVNPWVRSAASLGATRLKHYYIGRFWNLDFWGKLLKGRLDWADTIRSLSESLRAVFSRTTPEDQAAPVPFQTRMARSLRSFKGPVLLALSGNDFTAREFVDHAANDLEWRDLLDTANIRKVSLEAADHTFSSAAWRGWLEDQTLAWLDELVQRRPARVAST